jgi:hypothetical protein
VVAPYREDLVVAAECMFTWYWLADLWAAEGIAFVLGHALAMKAIHGAKATNDKMDSQKIAALLRGGLLPQAYVYPAANSPLEHVTCTPGHTPREIASGRLSRNSAPRGSRGADR